MKIISGGQSGADKACLDAAKKLNMETGGWMPKGFKTEDGPKPEYEKEYGLKCLESEKYPDRTMKNVDDSDGTIIFMLKPSIGSEFTIGYAQTGKWIKEIKNYSHKPHKPYLVISNLTDENKCSEQIKKFIKVNGIQTLNCAGHRETSAPINNFTEKVKNIMLNALKK